MIVVLFFGGWNAPFDWPFPFELALDPAGLGLGLLFVVGLAPVLGTVLLALPFWLGSSRISAPQALAIGFVLFNVLAGAAFLGWAFISFDWVVGLFWMMVKSYIFVIIFVQMRATFPRVRVDQLMGFAWKWLLPAALLNIFVTAVAVSIVATW